MPSTELGPQMLTTCGAEVVPLLLILALLFWGRWVAKKHDTRGWWIAAWLPVVGLVVQHVGIAITILGLIDAFESASAAAPEARATQLAQGIAHAMGATAIGVGLAVLLYLGCLVAYAIGTWLPAGQRGAPSPEPPPDPVSPPS